MVGTEPDPPKSNKKVCFLLWRDDLPALQCYAVTSRIVHYRKETIMSIDGVFLAKFFICPPELSSLGLMWNLLVLGAVCCPLKTGQ